MTESSGGPAGTSDGPGPTTTAQPGASIPRVLFVAIVGSSAVFIDGTVVNVALPVLQNDLAASMVELQWVIEAFLITLAALLLLGGTLGDRFGRKRVFALGMAGFAGASAWCGFAPDAAQLIGARALQGVFGALLVPGSLALINAHVPPDRRGRAIGLWAACTAAGVALGPLLGGWLIDQGSWRWIFFINIPLAAAVLLALSTGIPESRDPDHRGRFDWLGAVLATVGLGALVYGLLEAGRHGFASVEVIAAIVAGFVLLAAFVRVQARAEQPMMPLGLFRSRAFAGANLVTLLLYASLGAFFFFLPYNLIQVQGMSAFEAGAALLPVIVLVSSLSIVAGRVYDKIGARSPLAAGAIISAVGYALFFFPDHAANYWSGFLPGIVAVGLGTGLAVAPLTTVVMAAVPIERSGIAAGINNAASRIGGVLAIALLGLVMLNAFGARLDHHLVEIPLGAEARSTLDEERINLAAARLPDGIDDAVRTSLVGAIEDAFVAGFREVVVICAVLAFASGIAALLMIPGRLAPRRE